jgi:flagellar biosynthesis GTPase FlhF
MSSLAELPNLVGFFSYSRNDDEGDDGAITALANRIYRELRAQLGRNDQNFKLWRDKDALSAGEHWNEKLKEAVSESVFFIQMVSPSTLNSPFCRFEFESFVERERELGRNDLVFPILYISVPQLEEVREQTDGVISIAKERQYVDWRRIRHRNKDATEVKETVEEFCKDIVRALRRQWLSPEERKQIEAERRAQVEYRLQMEAKKQAEEEARQREADRKAEQDRARKEAERIEQKRRREKEETERQERKERELAAKRNAEEGSKRDDNLTATPIKVVETGSEADEKGLSGPSWLQIIGMFIVIVIFVGIVGGILLWTGMSLMPPR